MTTHEQTIAKDIQKLVSELLTSRHDFTAIAVAFPPDKHRCVSSPFNFVWRKSNDPASENVATWHEQLAEVMKPVRQLLSCEDKTAEYISQFEFANVHGGSADPKVPAVRVVPILMEQIALLMKWLRRLDPEAYMRLQVDVNPAEILIVARKRLRHSQAVAAEKMGVHENTVKNWENGKSKPNQESTTIITGYMSLRNT